MKGEKVLMLLTALVVFVVGFYAKYSKSRW